MFCKNCGQEADDTKKFCTNCGKAFTVPQNSEIKAQEPISRPLMPKEPWTIGRIIKTAVAIVFVGGIIFIKFGLGAINSLNSPAVEKNNSALNSYQSGANPSQVITQFQEASRDAITNDTKITTKINLAYVYSSEGNYDQALSTFKEAQALTSEDSFQYYLVAGEIALLEGKPNAALVAYNKAYEKSPDEFQINNALNLFYLDIASERPQYVNYPKALTYALKAQELQPSETTKQNLAIAYYFNENYTQTISLLSTSDYNKEPYIAYWLGLAYARKEDSVNAKHYLGIAINGGVKVPQEVTDYMNSN